MFIYIYIQTDVHIDFFPLYELLTTNERRLQNKISQFHQRQSSMQSNAYAKKTNVAVKHLKIRVKYCVMLIPAEKFPLVL